VAHRGTSMLDVISPCVTFNDHEGSTKSYSYVKDHDEPLADISFVPFFQDITVDYEPGTAKEISMHDGSRMILKKLGEDYDPTNKSEALRVLTEAHDKGEVVTGLFYVDTKRENFLDQLNVVDEPLATLPESRVRPPREALEELMEELR
jgi:2-oxoglutarate ferredoxin oxidoreductase subunit beta